MSAYVSSHKPSTSSSGYSVDPVREVGLEIEQKQYNTRLLALTKPADYAAARAAEFDKLVQAVDKSYKSSYAGFTDAGMPHEMAKGYALAAAETEKQVRRQILETLFPAGANLIGDAAMVRASSTSVAHLSGTGEQQPAQTPRPSETPPPAKRAPARRRR